jgi:hypothetical protein
MMARLARGMQRRAPPDPLFPVAARIVSSFNTALDTVSTHACARKNRAEIPLGATRGDILGNCRVAEKYARLIDALMFSFSNRIRDLS